MISVIGSRTFNISIGLSSIFEHFSEEFRGVSAHFRSECSSMEVHIFEKIVLSFKELTNFLIPSAYLVFELFLGPRIGVKSLTH